MQRRNLCMWSCPDHTFVLQPYRVEEYSAYYRYVKARLESACDSQHREETYPEPCAHCDVCRWFVNATRRRAVMIIFR